MLVSEQSAIPWCGDCDWNLDAFEPRPDDDQQGRWRVLKRWNHGIAFRLDQELFGVLSIDIPRSRGWSLARLVLIVVSVLLLGALIGLAALGGWLIGYRFPNPATIVLGIPLIGLAVLLRPRLFRFTGSYDTLTRADAPTLFALIERVGAEIGAPTPKTVIVDSSFNASAGVFGLRRRTVLRIGLPLWGVLGPQQRVALLGHELGHFVNGDPAHSLLTQPALRTLGQLALVLRPEALHSRSPIERLLMLIFWPFFWLASRAALIGQLVLAWIWMREHQRAEYAADAMAARVAGSVATVRMLDDLVLAPSIARAVRIAEVDARSRPRSLRDGAAEAGVAEWQRTAQRVRADRADRLSVLRQRTMRVGADLLASHPPAGRRARMVEAWPERSAAIVLSQAESDRIDAELAKRYTRAARDIAHSRY